MAGIRIEGNTSGNVGEVDANNNIHVNTPGHSAAGVERGGGPANAGAAVIFSENDPGEQTGSRFVASPETDADAQLRISLQSLLDAETFNYTAQNTGKFSYSNTTMTNAWTTNGLQTNSSSITTINTGTLLTSRAFFPLIGTSSTYVEFNATASAAIATNTTIDFGFFLTSGSNPYAPSDGIYFRYTSAGLRGVINYAGTETTTSLFSGFTLTPTARNQYIIVVTEREVEFWIDQVLYGTLGVPSGNGQPFASSSLPVAVRHAIGGTAASAACQFLVNDYTVTLGGATVADPLGTTFNRVLGSYQGLSGGTMGSLASFANSANPTSAAGSNTAANVTGLGGQGAINAAAAAATDFIMCSYQVPAGTTAVQGRRLRVSGVRISCLNLGAAVATTLTSLAFSLAFGHTAVSLATTEAATTKAPRRIALGTCWWAVGAAIGQGPSPGDIDVRFSSPVYVNPGEFIATTMKFMAGTATASQSIYYTVTFDYGWE